MGRKKLPEDKKKIKINITVESYQLDILKSMGPTVSEAIRKLIDDKLKGGLK